MTLETRATKAESQAPAGVDGTVPHHVFRPRVDIVEGKDAILLTADLPGADENGTDITLGKNVLTIRACVRPPKLEGYTLAFHEYEVGDFERAFTIADEIDRDGIGAVVKDGVLAVILPKVRQSENTRKITVRRSE